MSSDNFFSRNRCPKCQKHVDPWESPSGFDQEGIWVCKNCGERLVRATAGAGYTRAAVMAVCGAAAIIALDAWWMDLLAVAGFGVFALIRFPRWQVYKAHRRVIDWQEPPALHPEPVPTKPLEIDLGEHEHANA